jgi:hypothetical protein
MTPRFAWNSRTSRIAMGRGDVRLGIEEALPRRAIVGGIGIPSHPPEADAEVPENTKVDNDRHIALPHHEAEREHLVPAVRKERAQVVPAGRLEPSPIVKETIKGHLRREVSRDSHDGEVVVLVLDVPDGLEA